MTAQQRWILCGGLASGKSAVSRILDESGIDTIDADSVGHEVIDSDGPAFDEVARRWPSVVSNGEIDRAALAAIVFRDPAELRALEATTHPHIFDTIRTRAEQISGPVIVEMPILSDRLGDGWRRMVVDCRDEVRLQRAVGRGMTLRDAEARLASQPSRPEWLAAADLVLPNHGALDDLGESVLRVIPHL